MKRILILSASVGAGHLRAAQAVALALREVAPDAEVENRDVLTLTNAAFRRVYGKAYLDLVNRAPHLLGYFYDRLDRPRGKPRSMGDRLRLHAEKANLKPFIQFLESKQWDVVVNTHFLPAEIIASLKRKNKFPAPQITVTTDFDTHRLWVNSPCERYTTATEEGAAYLSLLGVPAESIRVTGIPVHPVFARPKTREACLASQELSAERPVVLVLSGGFGVGPVATIYRAVLSTGRSLTAVVVAGKNETVRKELAAAPVPTRHRAHVLGFTDKMDELMAAADIVVSKPGGLTTSEVLARGAAMAIVNPIPGQESRNSDYLLENGAAVKINRVATLHMKIEKLLSDPKRLADLKANARRLGHPRAAYEVAELALSLVKRQ